MNYSTEFKKLIQNSDSKNQNDYIGTGNPNAKILIIGKECAINTKIKPEQFKSEISENIYRWKENLKNPDLIIQNWDGNPNSINPLFPYKGQNFTIFKGKHNGGTSDTWYKYQKLHNNIFNSQSTEIVFHNSFFISELNANTSSYSKDQNPNDKKFSISERVSNFFNSSFIQNFPVIILATSHYTREHNIDICKLFNVVFKEPTIQIESNPKQWYNVHMNRQGEKLKLVIHTRQLSMDIKDKLLEEIANEIKLFADKNKILI